MNKTLIAGGALAGLIAAGSIAGMVSAQSVAEATGLTEEQVIEIALSEIPGEVTEVDQETRRGNTFYEVEVMGEDGTAMELKIDAETGEVLKVRADGEGCDDRRGGHRHHDRADDAETEGEDA